jgi:hypothetical protein
MNDIIKLTRQLLKTNVMETIGDATLYLTSVHEKDGGAYFMVRDGRGRHFVAAGGEYELFKGEDFDADGVACRCCPLTAENAAVLMKLFPFTAPSCHRGRPTTLGLGDRLGLASGGHIQTVRDRNVFPVLAQQSMRELNLTGRTYPDVLAAAAFAVFQEDYHGGYGADGDHLKTPEELRYALDSGFTMITLDCSEQIDNTVSSQTIAERNERYAALDSGIRTHYEKYLGQKFYVDGLEISITEDELKEIVLTYHKAIEYTIHVYKDIIATCGRPIDFEMSIDETLSHTSPNAHYVVASELVAGGVVITSLAPRFIGEFQKGIDYIGMTTAFDADFAKHQRIAKGLGYKLSVHSGSDKFSVFPIVGAQTGLVVHVKTAGTNWLEALRVIAAKEPALYRRLHSFAVENLDKARAYYHINGKPENMAPLSETPDDKLVSYLDVDDSRQVLHITYGLMLSEKNDDGSFVFKDELYAALNKHEAEYNAALIKHIGKHLDALGV